MTVENIESIERFCSLRIFKLFLNMEDDGRNEEEGQYFCNNKNVKHNHVGKIEKIRKNHKSIL